MKNVSVWRPPEIKGWGHLTALIPFVFYGSIAALGYYFCGPRSDLFWGGSLVVVFFVLIYVCGLLYGLTKGLVKEIWINWDIKKIRVTRKPFGRPPVAKVYESSDFRSIVLNTYDGEISIIYMQGERISLNSEFTEKVATSPKEFAIRMLDEFGVPISKFHEYFDGGGGGG
jgi:hypothetical protein